MAGAGAAQYLQELPSKGYFSSSLPPSTPGGLRVYVCDHETAPPVEQLIKTDGTNILIRALTIKKGRVDQKGKDNKRKAPVDDAKGKRPAERSVDDKALTKRVNTTGGPNVSRIDTIQSRVERELQSFTVQKLKSLLKEKGQPLKGNKDELIARLKRCLT